METLSYSLFTFHNLHFSFIFINSAGAIQVPAPSPPCATFQTNEHDVKANRGGLGS